MDEKQIKFKGMVAMCSDEGCVRCSTDLVNDGKYGNKCLCECGSNDFSFFGPMFYTSLVFK
jgi:hypothetical protein